MLSNTGASSSPSIVSDHDLLASLQRGESDAFRELYNRYARLVYRYIYLRLNQTQDAEDLTAETFIRAWRAIATFQWREIQLGAWLFRIAHNLIVDKSRRKREFLDRLPWQRGQTENEYASVEQRDELAKALSSLNHEQQVIVYLNFFEGYDLAEIAQFLGKSINAVTVARFRALQHLRKVLRNQGSEFTNQHSGISAQGKT